MTTPTPKPTPGGHDAYFVPPPAKTYADGLREAADIASSMGYDATARAILAGGDPEKLEALLDERARTLVAPTVAMREALASLVAERARQEKKFPGVRGPLDTAPLLTRGSWKLEIEGLLYAVRTIADDAEAPIVFAFLEEALEAVSESDPEKLAVELVQVAALAVKWLQAINARAGK